MQRLETINGTASWFAAACLVMLSACGARAVEAERTYYVDFANGSDDAAGTSAQAAWRHAPGDPNSKGEPAQTTLRAGDTVLFRGGVVYRGSIVARSSGEASKPIVYRGDGFGEGRAILSGRDEFQVSPTRCLDDPACSRLPEASSIQIFALPLAVAVSDQVLLEGRALELAQTPETPDPFWFDDLKYFAETPRNSLTVEADEETWRMHNPALRKALGDWPANDLVLHLWRVPNAISSLPVTDYDAGASAIVFKARKLTPYPNRSSLFALANHPALIRRPYQFATVDRGARIFVKAPATARSHVEISRRKNAFNVTGQQYVTVEGFEIVGYAGGSTDWNSGTALLVGMPGGGGITFRRNKVHDLTSWSGAAAVSANRVSRLTVTDNEFDRLQRGGGVGVGTASSDILVQGNRFSQIGRTGIAILGAERVWLDRNTVTDLYSVHANGMAIYLDNRDVLVSNNQVRRTPRAITFQGGPASDRLTIRHNLLLGSGRDGSAIQSWGDKARGVTIEGNVIAVDEGGAAALRLNGGNTGLTIQNNLIMGLLINGAAPGDWVVSNNIYALENYGGRTGSAAVFDGQNKFKSSLGRAGLSLAKDASTDDPNLCEVLLRADTTPPAWLGQLGGDAPASGVGPAGACVK